METSVFLIPGLHGTAALFGPFSSLAPRGFQCQAIPLPTGGDQGPDALAARMAETLPQAERFVLVAESFGGPVAARLAEHFPGRVILLVLSNPLTTVPVPFPAGLARSLMQSRRMPVGAVAFMMAGGDRTLAKALLRELHSLPPETLKGRLAATSRSKGNYIPEHAGCRMLTLLGTSDRLISPAKSRKILAPIPNNTLVEIEAPHLLLQTRPAEAWQAILRELKVGEGQGAPERTAAEGALDR